MENETEINTLVSSTLVNFAEKSSLLNENIDENMAMLSFTILNILKEENVKVYDFIMFQLHETEETQH